MDLNSIPGVMDDPKLGLTLVHLILEGRATNLYEAVDLYLDDSLPEIMKLIGSPLTNDELEHHPLMVMLGWHGMQRREDSLL